MRYDYNSLYYNHHSYFFYYAIDCCLRNPRQWKDQKSPRSRIVSHSKVRKTSRDYQRRVSRNLQEIGILKYSKKYVDAQE